MLFCALLVISPGVSFQTEHNVRDGSYIFVFHHQPERLIIHRGVDGSQQGRVISENKTNQVGLFLNCIYNKLGVARFLSFNTWADNYWSRCKWGSRAFRAHAGAKVNSCWQQLDGQTFFFFLIKYFRFSVIHLWQHVEQLVFLHGSYMRLSFEGNIRGKCETRERNKKIYSPR